MPSLYIVTFVALFISYYVNKLMCLEMYKTLKKPSLVKVSIKMLVFGVIAHEILGIFMLTEPSMQDQEPTEWMAGVDWANYLPFKERWVLKFQMRFKKGSLV